MSAAFRVVDAVVLNATFFGLRVDFYSDFTREMEISAPSLLPGGSTYRNEVAPDDPFGCTSNILRQDWL